MFGNFLKLSQKEFFGQISYCAADNYQDANNNNNQQVNLQHPNLVCKCPGFRRDTCLSSLCCEICKLFPNQNLNTSNNQNGLLKKQAPNNLVKNPGNNINEINYQR
jgi:hypothetical protein